MPGSDTVELNVPSSTARSPIAATVHHWPVSLTLAVLGLVAGLLFARSTPVTYRSEARLAVGPGSNSAYVIPGYPLAARDLAANYSRWVQNNTKNNAWALPEVTDVSASPIPDSGVIRVEAESTKTQTATKGAQFVADRLVGAVAQAQKKNDPEAALVQFRKLAPAVAKAQAAVDRARSPKALLAARVSLAEAQLARDAKGDLYRRLASDPQAVSQLEVISPAAPTGNDRTASLLRWGLVGLGAGLLLALVIAALRDRLAAVRNRASRDAQVASGPSAQSSGPLPASP